MKNYFDVNDYPKLKEEINKITKLLQENLYKEERTKENFKESFRIVYKILFNKTLFNQLKDCEVLFQEKLKEYNSGITPVQTTTESELQVMKNKWERFVKYTLYSAQHNGKVNSGENLNAYQWLRNNNLLNFQFTTDIKTLPTPIKELIVFAAKNKFDGVKIVKNEEGKSVVRLTYLQEYITNEEDDENIDTLF